MVTGARCAQAAPGAAKSSAAHNTTPARRVAARRAQCSFILSPLVSRCDENASNAKPRATGAHAIALLHRARIVDRQQAYREEGGMTDTVVVQEKPAAVVSQPITAAASLAALGIVYGDLGTSPLYTLPTIIEGVGGAFSPQIGLGILSLIFWALILTVSLKYCVFVMRADNHGEGGILALMALVAGRGYSRAPVLVVMGLFGAALIYGDGIITPAISVLSALEGLNILTDAFKPYTVPVA